MSISKSKRRFNRLAYLRLSAYFLSVSKVLLLLLYYYYIKSIIPICICYFCVQAIKTCIQKCAFAASMRMSVAQPTWLRKRLIKNKQNRKTKPQHNIPILRSILMLVREWEKKQALQRILHHVRQPTWIQNAKPSIFLEWLAIDQWNVVIVHSVRSNDFRT